MLSKDIEISIVSNIVKCSEWGYPITEFEVRLFVKYHLSVVGCTVKSFRIVSPPKYLRRGVLEFDISIDDIIETMKLPGYWYIFFKL